MKNALVVVSILVLSGCDLIPGSTNKEISNACINHANLSATDFELETMGNGIDSESRRTIGQHNCGYYFLNSEAISNPGSLTKADIGACEAIRPKLHAAALHHKKLVQTICLSMNQ